MPRKNDNLLILISWWIGVIAMAIGLLYPSFSVVDNQLATLILADLPCKIDRILFSFEVLDSFFTSPLYRIPTTFWTGHNVMSFSRRHFSFI